MTTRQDAIEALKNLEDWEANKAILEAYLEAPIPDAELWENRESIAKLLGPWEQQDKQGIEEFWCREDLNSRVAVSVFKRTNEGTYTSGYGTEFDDLDLAKFRSDFVALGKGFRFVDGPVTLAPKSKGKLGPWTKQPYSSMDWERWFREDANGDPWGAVFADNKGKFFGRLNRGDLDTAELAFAAEDKWLMEQGWELEGGPVVVEPREEPKKEAGEKALAEEVNEVKTVLCWLADRVSDTTRPIPTSVTDDLRAKVEELESRHNEVDRVNSAQAEAIDDLRTKVVKLEEAKTILTREVRRLQELDVTGYDTLKSQFLADCAFRKEILLKLCGAWRLSVDKDYIFRDNTPASIAILQLGYQAQFGSNSYWFADLSSAKAWCDEQLRAAGYLLEDGEKT